MDTQPRIGQPVITEHGIGTVTTISVGDADTDILRYLVSHADNHAWHYLDEIILVPDVSVEP